MSPDQESKTERKSRCHIGVRFSRVEPEIKVVWLRGKVAGFEAGAESEEWLLRVCSRLEEGVASRKVSGGKKGTARIE